VIELLLQAERALAVGMLDQAERLYWQAIEGDPRNSIAVVGLARVALDRGDERTALLFARKALELDPENAAAQRLEARMDEVLRHRGLPHPGEAAARPAPTPAVPGEAAAPGTPSEPAADAPAAGRLAPEGWPGPDASELPTSPSANPDRSDPPAPRRKGLVGRLLGRR